MLSENFIDFGLETAEKQLIARNMGGKNILLPYTLRSTEVMGTSITIRNVLDRFRPRPQ